MKLASLSALFSSRAPQRRASKQRFFRSILVETLETRQLFATDITDFVTPIQNEVTASLISPEAPDDAQQSLQEYRDSVRNYVDAVAPQLGTDSVKRPSALSQYAKQAQADNKIDFSKSSAAAWQDFADRLTSGVGGTTQVDTTGLDALRGLSNQSDAIQQSMLGGGMPDANGDDAIQAQVAAALGSSQNILANYFSYNTNALPDPGALPLQAIDETNSVPLIEDNSEGEETPNALAVPTASLPAMVLGSAIDQFSSSGMTTGTTKSHFGGFTDSTTAANANLTLPGLSWTHVVTRSYTDATHWSVTETLVLAFNFTTSNSTSPSLNTNPGTSTTTTSHFATGTGSSSMTASRSGHLFLTLHAEQGITTAAAAGIAWSINASYADDLTLSVAASASTSVTPNPNFVDPALSQTNVNPPPVPVPTGYSNQSSWSASASLHFVQGGTMYASGTPSIVSVSGGGTSIETDISFANTSQKNISFTLGSSAGYSEQSGNLPITVPINGVFADPYANGTGSSSSSSTNGTFPNDTPQLPTPTSGSGHSLGSSNSGSSTTGGSQTRDFSMQAKLRADGSLKAISGKIRDQFSNAIADQDSDNASLTLRYQEDVGGNNFTAVMSGGKKVSDSVAAEALSSFDVDLGLSASGAIQIATTNDNDAGIELNSSGSEVTFDFIKVSGTTNSATTLTTTTGNGTLTEFTLDRLTYSLDADADVGNGVSDTATAQGESKTRHFESETYIGNLTVTNYVSDSNIKAADGSLGFDRTTTKRIDMWSIDDTAITTMDNSLASNGSVNSTVTASETATEKLLYDTDYKYDRQHYGTTARELISETRHAHYEPQIVTTIQVNSNNTNPVVSTPTRSGDSRVNVTGERHTRNEKKSTGGGPGGPGGGGGGTWVYDDVTINYVTGQYVYTTNHVMQQGEGGEPTGGSTSYVIANWDARNIEEHELDGSPVPQAPSISDPVLSTSIESFVPARLKSGPTMLESMAEWFGGKKGDATDQTINFTSGVGDNLTLNLSYGIRHYIVGYDQIDYDSTAYSAGEWTGFVVSLPAGVKGAVSGAKALRSAANNFDEAGKCANWLTKVIRGGCFVAGTLVSVSDLPYSSNCDQQLWADSSWLWDADANPTSPHKMAPFIPLLSRRLLVPIEQVPLGARVPTKNPRPWEFDDSLPAPDEATWAKISITVERSDGAIVDAELIRPRSWVESNRVRAGQRLLLNIPELEIAGFAFVETIDECPPIANGEGSVITGRFLTRQVDVIVKAEVVSIDDTTEIIEGTVSHPIWSVDRNDWVPLGMLREGERLQGDEEVVIVRSLVIVPCSVPVHNIEVEGEHVYEVGKSCLLVHNATDDCAELLYRFGTSRESAGRLARKAVEAEQVIGIHGVSVSGAAAANASSALRSTIEKSFRVIDTPTRMDALHKTIELPKPVTQAVADLFNRVFGR